MLVCAFCPAASLDVAAASSVPIVFGTAHLALRLRANLQPGQTVLVLGASGGVGTAAIQVGTKASVPAAPHINVLMLLCCMILLGFG